MRHFVGNGGGIGVVEHACIIPRAWDADADGIVKTRSAGAALPLRFDIPGEQLGRKVGQLAPTRVLCMAER
tara:strand:- start:309 stop:521 length:213 start_codon:yes stop_codon:yes gene_type:complete